MSNSQANNLRKLWQDPAFRKKQREAASQRMIAVWKDPETKAKQSHSISQGKILAVKQITEVISVDPENVLNSVLDLLDSRPDLRGRLKSILDRGR